MAQIDFSPKVDSEAYWKIICFTTTTKNKIQILNHVSKINSLSDQAKLKGFILDKKDGIFILSKWKRGKEGDKGLGE